MTFFWKRESILFVISINVLLPLCQLNFKHIFIKTNLSQTVIYARVLFLYKLNQDTA